MRGVFNWFGVEANARAVATLLGVGGALGAVVVFVWVYLIAPAIPEVGVGPYADGYRAAKRITELEQRVRALEVEAEMNRVMSERGTPEDTKRRLRDGTF